VKPIAQDVVRGAAEIEMLQHLLPLVCPAVQLAQLADTPVSGPRQAYRVYRRYRALAFELHKKALDMPDQKDARELRAKVLRLAAFVDELTATQLILQRVEIKAEIDRRFDALASAAESYARRVVEKRTARNHGLALVLSAPDFVQGLVFYDFRSQPGVSVVLDDLDPAFQQASECIESL